MAFDHPDDDGTAVDVVWEPSSVDDFASYTVWVSNLPVSDLSLAYAAFGTNPATCGCFSFNKQWIDERTNPIELTLSTALYVAEGGTLAEGSPQLVKPGVELFVAVTVHDLKGNVHLTELTEASVTPVDNLNDVSAPDRITELALTDRPNDDGSALLSTSHSLMQMTSEVTRSMPLRLPSRPSIKPVFFPNKPNPWSRSTRWTGRQVSL